MMKIEINVHGPRSTAALVAFLPEFQAAATADEAERDEKFWSHKDKAEVTAALEEAEPAPQAEKPKRTRKAVEPAPEPAPNITATPEAREPVVEPTPEPTKAITADDIRTALNAIVAKFGMPYATSNVQRLLGAPKVGAVEPATYPEVLARLEAELAVEDING